MSSEFVKYKNQLLGLLHGLNYKNYATDNETEQTIKHINYGLKKLSTLNIKEAIEERKLREEQEKMMNKMKDSSYSYPQIKKMVSNTDTAKP